jgi:hypothetical protein
MIILKNIKRQVSRYLPDARPSWKRPRPAECAAPARAYDRELNRCHTTTTPRRLSLSRSYGSAVRQCCLSDWASYRRHLPMIEANAYMKPWTRKSARGGRSLLAGLLRCRRCGHMLQISYSGRDSASPNSRCLRRHHQTGSAACVTCSGKAVDDAVSQQILLAIAPQAIDGRPLIRPPSSRRHARE